MTVLPIQGEPAAARADDSVLFAYTTLRSRILAGDLEPGSMLSQVQLAQTLGISRTPLREALNRLATEHLVTGDFNRRMRVSELNLDDVDQIYAMRISLEPVGIHATVPFLDPAERHALTLTVQEMTTAIDVHDLERFRREHRAFHLGLVSGSGARMRALLADLWDHSERYRLAYLQHDYTDIDSASGERLRASQDEHRDILRAALEGDARGCADHLVAHLCRTVDVVFHEHAKVPSPHLVQLAVQARDEERR